MDNKQVAAELLKLASNVLADYKAWHPNLPKKKKLVKDLAKDVRDQTGVGVDVIRKIIDAIFSGRLSQSMIDANKWPIRWDAIEGPNGTYSLSAIRKLKLARAAEVSEKRILNVQKQNQKVRSIVVRALKGKRPTERERDFLRGAYWDLSLPKYMGNVSLYQWVEDGFPNIEEF